MPTRLASLILAVLLVPQTVFAQTSTPVAPRGGSFGGAVGSSSRDHLDLTASIAGAFDTEAAPELLARINQRNPQAGGYSSMLTGEMTFERRRSRSTVTGAIFSAGQYFPQLDRVIALTHGAMIGASVRLPGRSSLNLTQTADYSPSYFYRLFPSVSEPAFGAVVPAAAPNYRVEESRSFANSTQATFAIGNDRAVRLSASLEHQSTVFESNDTRPDLDTVTGSGKFALGLGRTGTVSMEYEQRRGRFGYGGLGTEYRLRVGGGISPALSTSRRAEFHASVSPSVTDFDATGEPRSNVPRQHRVEGEASAFYPFLRTWSAGGSYRRGIEYSALFNQPLFRQAARFEAAGLVALRWDVALTAGYFTGTSAIHGGGRPLETYTGSVMARFALSQTVACFGEYLHYYYDLRGQRALAPSLPASFDQKGIRVGLSLWTRPVGR